jgi:hypothetical protein
MKISLALTPSFLGFDFLRAAPIELEQFCEKIVELAPLVRRDEGIEIVLDDTIVAVLTECNRYPYPPLLRAALKSCELDRTYSAEDLIRVLHRILQSDLKPLGEYFGISDVLFDDNKVVVPQSVVADECPEIRAANENFFVIWALARARGEKFGADLHCYVASQDEIAGVRGCAIAVEPPEFAECSPDGFVFAVEVPVIPLGSSIADRVNAAEFWRAAENGRDLYLAVAMGAYQIHRLNGGAGKWPEIARNRIGQHFFRSIQMNAASGEGSHSGLTFETCARVLAGIPKYEAKQFITTIRPDCVRAWRTHINKSGEALRLMYWELRDGRLELANVGPKSEEEILDGDPSVAISLY